MSNSSTEEGVRASQIDTSIQFSQRTVNDLFGSSSGSEPDLSQSAVTRAFDLPSEGLLLDASQLEEAAAGLQLLSGASGAESVDEADDESPVGESRRPRRCHPQIVEKDINFVPDNENPSLYESFSSSESDGVAYQDSEEDTDNARQDDDCDDVISDGDAADMDEAFIASLQMDALDRRSVQQCQDALRGTEWTPVSSSYETDVDAYPGLNMEQTQPVSELRRLCHSPLLTFFYFMPKSMWVRINYESNVYSLQQVNRRAEEIQGRQAKQGDHRQETLKNIQRRLKAKIPYQTHEILHVIGLLVARMLCPQKNFRSHWSMVQDGAVPARSFGHFMGRNRCQDILRDLHFVDNQSERNRDKLWKLRPVITKAGKRNTEEDSSSTFDHKTGAAAVVRNLRIVLAQNERHRWHAVVVDRYYSFILLAVELLKMNVYVVGTVIVNRLGLDKNLKVKSATRPANVPRGEFTFSRSVAIPSMVAFHWWDRKPVHYLCTGVVMTASSIQRKVKQVGAVSVPCPTAVNDYQGWMGGVDVHDQLRLQAYSLQTSTRFKKYYKGLFLGFVDLVLVNSYISHTETAQITGTTPMGRRKWFGVLQNQLLQLKAEDFSGVVATPPPTTSNRKRAPVRLTHVLEQSEDWKEEVIRYDFLLRAVLCG
ncbi:hypothetical protein PHPALM_30528 [Phytophthora palmivora]|uniref:PiggyBac transposable element-derived protein domain-containing protein n=1 Tax=Phytophthora palmivora TaxID=4796 RepID=A0A2P4X4X5_9STRA|nr:hypothetical protein PHPALM_30528 [Phytophthora palmivora]